MNTGSQFHEMTNLPKPYFNSSGKKVLEYISSSEIVLDLHFINTQNKRLKLNTPYLKTEHNLSGHKISAIILLDFKLSKSIISLLTQDLKSKRTLTLEWNMEYTGSFYLWSLSDFEAIMACHKERI